MTVVRALTDTQRRGLKRAQAEDRRRTRTLRRLANRNVLLAVAFMIVAHHFIIENLLGRGL